MTAETARAFFAALASGTADALDAVVAPEAAFAVVPAGLQGRWGGEGRPFLQALRKAHPDLKLELVSVIADEHGAVVETTARTGDDPGVAQAWSLTIDGGRITGIRGLWSSGRLEPVAAGAATPQPAVAPAPASPAAEIALAFIACLGKGDVDGMTDLCDPMAAFNDVGFVLGGRQRVLHGRGRVSGIGKVIWTAMVEAFPDLNCTVTRITDDGSGHVAVEATLAGTQAKPWWAVHCAGQAFGAPYLFVFNVNDNRTIDAVTIYCDRAGQNRQLGLTEAA